VFGDLNFRLQLGYDIDTESVLKQINSGEFENLIKRDDLMVHGGSIDYLQGFQEGKIQFAPTYKYQIGT
jgi:inositol-1,4,5-trisphosphate 5-phosphatase